MVNTFRRFGAGIVALTLLATFIVAPVTAATTYTLTPWTFVGTASQCGGTAGTPGNVVSRWDSTTGNPAPSLLLAKSAPTTDCSSAGATVNGVSGITLTELNFDVNGYCGAGAPRFNVVTSDNVTHFFGCVYGTHTTLANGWTHVVFTPGQGLPAIAPGTTVQSINLVQDEQGTTHLDNISINDQVIGGPATTANDCKDGGWKNLKDANGNSFKNQGQCVSYFNHQNKGDDDQGDDDGGNGHNGDD